MSNDRAMGGAYLEGQFKVLHGRTVGGVGRAVGGVVQAQGGVKVFIVHSQAVGGAVKRVQ